MAGSRFAQSCLRPRGGWKRTAARFGQRRGGGSRSGPAGVNFAVGAPAYHPLPLRLPWLRRSSFSAPRWNLIDCSKDDLHCRGGRRNLRRPLASGKKMDRGRKAIPNRSANPRLCKLSRSFAPQVPPRPGFRRLSAYLFFVLPELAYGETEVVDSQAGGHRRSDKTQIGFDVAEEGVPAISDHETRDLE